MEATISTQWQVTLRGPGWRLSSCIFLARRAGLGRGPSRRAKANTRPLDIASGVTGLGAPAGPDLPRPREVRTELHC
jgi:hypothetical protein